MDDQQYQKKSFDKQADFYEKLYGDQSEFEKEIVQKRKNLIMNSEKSGTALDLGCGTGTFLKFISKKAQKVFAVDPSEKMLSKAKERAKKEKITNVKIIAANALALPFKNNFFDSVYCINTFYHIKEKEKAISEISRTLNQNGKAYVEFYNFLSPFAFLRFFANPFAKKMPHVYPDFIPSLKNAFLKYGLAPLRIEVFSNIETSEAVRQWLPSFLFKLLVSYKKFSEKYTLFGLPKMRCVIVAQKIR